jgi:hypothetical protein
MKKGTICILMLSVLLSAGYGNGLTASSLIGSVGGAGGTFAGQPLSTNDQVAVPLRFADDLRVGMPIAPTASSPSFVHGGFTNKFNGSWSTICAQIGGVWYAFTLDADGQTLDENALPDFTPTDAMSLNSGSLAIPPLLNIRMTADLTLINGKSAAGVGATLVSHTTLDIRDIDNQTIYVVSPDLSNGIKVHLKLAYSFEVASTTLQSYLNQDSNDTLRETLVYWVMGFNSAANETNPNLKLDATLLATLVTPPASLAVDVATLRNNVLALLRSELNLQLDSTLAIQTWGFPTYRLYQATPATTEYSDAFFIVLDRKTLNQNQQRMVTSPTDQVNVIASGDASNLANMALGYLEGANYPASIFDSLPFTQANGDLTNIYNSVQQIGSNSTYSNQSPLPASLGLNANLLLGSSATQQTLSSTMTLTIPQILGPSSTFQNPLLFVPSGPNIISATSVTNYSALATYLQPVAKLPTDPSATIEIDFQTPQPVQSLVLWLSANASFQVQAYSGTQPVGTSSNGSLVTSASGPAASTKAVPWTLGSPNPLGTSNALGLVSWSSPLTADRVVITMNSGTVYNLRAYAQPTTLVGQTYMLSADGTKITISGSTSLQPPELFSNSGGNSYSYFIQQAGATVPGNSPSHQLYFQPIWYAAGGLETPLSFDLKVLNNQFWAQKLNRPSGFAVTEFDFNRNGRVNSNFTYVDGFRPIAVPASVSQGGNYMYPYTYGVQVSSASGIVTAPSSPLYVEKIAGVDSLGMLWSAMQFQKLNSRTDPSFTTRYTARTSFLSFNQVVGAANSNPWSNYPSNTVYQLGSKWLLDNSYAVTDLTTSQNGDLVVGYEGSELVVGIVVKVVKTNLDPNPQKNIVVLTINRATKRAIYSTWAEMSLTPNAYHLRRLVVPSDSAPTTASGYLWLNQNFPTSQALILSYKLDTTDDPDHFKQWVPNTGEFRYLGPIHFTSRDGSDLADLVEGAPWKVTRAVNFSGMVQNEGSSFIQSTTKTVFHLVALDRAISEDGISVVPLSSALPSAEANGASYLDLYTFTIGNDNTYDSGISLNANWDPSRWKMVITKSALQVVDLLNKKVYADFAVIATGLNNNTSPVPGDDIQIAFEADTGEGTAISGTSEAPRLAVYDKKMLWRANLYVDEGGGKADWNDRHPWITGNEWNPPGGDGGQDVMRISPWSSFYGKGANTYNSVAYNIGSMDSPKQFNSNLGVQAAAMDSLATEDATTMGLDFISLRHKNGATIAPQNDWKNYVSPSVGLRARTYTAPPYSWVVYYAVYGDTDSGEISKIIQPRFAVTGSTAQIPGLSSYVLEGNVPTSVTALNPAFTFDLEGDIFDSNGNPISIVYDQDDYATGTDCSGFFCRSANYTGNPYTLNSGGAAIHVTTSYLSQYSVLIQPVMSQVQPPDTLPNLRYAVPGDILNRYDDHVVIVSQITPNDDGTVSSPGQIKVIQSGEGHNFEWQVIPELLWDENSGMGVKKWWKYELRRAITQ